MAISKKQKEEILQKLVDDFAKSKSVVFARNDGLSVEKISEFRGKLRDGNGKFKIAKKTLIKIAAQKNGVEEIADEFVDGAIGAVFSFDDEIFGAKQTFEFSKKNKKLQISGGIFFGKISDKNEVEKLAKIPPRDELLAKFVGCAAAPISGFVGIGKSLVGGFVRVLDSIREQKSAEEK
jgi:large subunit ribosomal protein L10